MLNWREIKLINVFEDMNVKGQKKEKITVLIKSVFPIKQRCY